MVIIKKITEIIKPLACMFSLTCETLNRSTTFNFSASILSNLWISLSCKITTIVKVFLTRDPCVCRRVALIKIKHFGTYYADLTQNKHIKKLCNDNLLVYNGKIISYSRTKTSFPADGYEVSTERLKDVSSIGVIVLVRAWQDGGLLLSVETWSTTGAHVDYTRSPVHTLPHSHHITQDRLHRTTRDRYRTRLRWITASHPGIISSSRPRILSFRYYDLYTYMVSVVYRLIW